MTKLAILEYPDPRLRTRAEPVTVFDAELRQLSENMLETMYAAPGIGLAATQVNVHRRILVADLSQDHDSPLVLVNPQVLNDEGREVMEEGCLSVPGVFDEVQRAQRIRVRAQDLEGRTFEMEAEGLLAVCIQHEIDHLNGKLFVDYLSDLKRSRIRRKLDKERRQRAENPAGRSPQPPAI